MNLAAIDYIVCLVILIPVLFVGWFSSKRSRTIRTTKEFLLAGKGINKLQAGFSMAATDFGGSGLVGAIGYCYTVGLSGTWWNLAAAPAFLLVGIFLARRLNTMGSSTLPEYFGRRFSPAVKYLTCFMHVCAGIASLAVQFTVSCTVLHVLSGIDMTLSLVISMFLVVALTSGGLRSVVNTDSALFVIIVLSILAAVPVTLSASGGAAELLSRVPDSFLRFDQLGFWTPMSWILLCTLTYSTNQHYIQRMVAAKDEGTAVFAAVFTAGFYVIISLALGFIGIAASYLLPGIEDTNSVFPEILLGYFPHGLLGLGLAAVFAATISTGTSILHSVTTLVVNDLWKPTIGRNAQDKTELRLSRVLVYVIAIFGLGISLLSSDIVNICYIGGLFYSVSAFLPMVFGLHGKFITTKAALVSIVATVALSLLWEYLPALRPAALSALPSNFFGLFVSLALITLVSLIERRGRLRTGGEAQ